MEVQVGVHIFHHLFTLCFFVVVFKLFKNGMWIFFFFFFSVVVLQLLFFVVVVVFKLEGFLINIDLKKIKK